MNQELKSALYVHIPFCPTGCKFCHFYIEGRKQSGYIDLLKKEYFLRFGKQKKQVHCIHIGGGTPNMLSLGELEELLSFLHKTFYGYEEFSIELHPSLLNKQQLEVCKKYGVNRISFGIQSLDEKILFLHTRVKANYDKLGGLVEYAQKLGFEKINFDFIYDLIGDSQENIQNNINFIKNHNPTSVYYYRLRKFTDHLKKNHTSNEKRAFAYYLQIRNSFKGLCYTRLNNAVHYDKRKIGDTPAFLYDEIIYSTDHELIGLGVAATSESKKGEFLKNFCNFEQYKNSIIDDKIPTDLHFYIDSQPQILNRFYFYLLQKHTFFLQDFTEIFGKNPILESKIQELQTIEFISYDQEKISLTEKGHYYFDEKLGDILFSEYGNEYELLKKL